MRLPERDEAVNWVDRDVVDRDGSEIGRAVRVYGDTDTGAPEWILVELPSGGGLRFVPLLDAQADDDQVRVAVSRTVVATAPEGASPDQLSPEEEAVFYRHYGIDRSQEASSSFLPAEDAQLEPPATEGQPEPVEAAAAPAAVQERVETRTAEVGSHRLEEESPEPEPAPMAAPVTPRAAYTPEPVSDRSSGPGIAAAAAVAAAAALVGLGWLWRQRRRSRRESLKARRRKATGTTRGTARSLSAATSTALGAGTRAVRSGQHDLSRSAAPALRQTVTATRPALRQAAATGTAVGLSAVGAGKQAGQKAGEVARGIGERASVVAREAGHRLGAGAAAATAPAALAGHQVAEVAGELSDQLSGGAQAARKRWRRTMGKVTALLGFGVGYVVGARAGRERYEQIVEGAQRLWQRPEVQQAKATATHKVEEVGGAGGAAQKAKSFVKEKTGGESDEFSTAGYSAGTAATAGAGTTSTADTDLDSVVTLPSEPMVTDDEALVTDTDPLSGEPVGATDPLTLPGEPVIADPSAGRRDDLP